MELRNFMGGFESILEALAGLESIGIVGSIRSSLDQFRSDANRLIVAQGLASLPDDVLSNVFIEGHDARAKNNCKFPIAISQVCRHFRAVAVRTPSLWNSVALMMPKEMVLTFFATQRGRKNSRGYIGLMDWNAVDALSPRTRCWTGLFSGHP